MTLKNRLALVLAASVAVSGAIRCSAADAPADPYSKLATIDFAPSAAATAQPIVEEIRAAKIEAYPAIEKKLLDAVSKPDATVASRQFAGDLLKIVGSKAAIPTLLSWLSDEKSRDAALYALNALKGVSDGELTEALPKASGPSRLGLVKVMSVADDNRVLGELAKYAKGTEAAEVNAAIRSLGIIGTAQAAAVLQSDGFSAEFDQEREQAMIAVANHLLGQKQSQSAQQIFANLINSPRVNIVGAALSGLAAVDSNSALPQLLKSLSDQRPQIAVRAARLLQSLPDAKVTTTLCAELPLLPVNVQPALIRTLTQRGDKSAFSAIKQAMDSADEIVRAEAVRACLTLGDESMIQPLLALASAPIVKATGPTDTLGTGGGPKEAVPTSGPVAEAAMETLGQMKAPGIESILMTNLDAAKPDTVRAAATILVNRGYRAALPKLLELIGNKDKTIRDAGLKNSEAFVGVNDVPSLIGLMEKTAQQDDRERVARVLWMSCRVINPKEDRFAYLWKAVQSSSDKPTKMSVLGQAAAAGGEAPLKVIREQLKSTEPDIFDAAARTLFAWPDESAAGDILGVIKTSSNRTYQVLGTRALSTRFTDSRAKTLLDKRIAMLKEASAALEKPEDKKIADWAVEKLLNPKAAEPKK